MHSEAAMPGPLPAPHRSEAFAEDLEETLPRPVPGRSRSWLVALPVTLALLGTLGLMIAQPA